MNLPQEILDIVIDSLAWSYKEVPAAKALHICLTISRSFYLRARYHIFSKISIINKSENQPRETQIRMVELLQLLEYNYPSPGGDRFAPLATCITSFTLHLRCTQSTVYSILDNGTFSRILSHFYGPNQGISHFSLDLWHPTSFRRFGNEFQQAFQALCQSPRLKNIELTSFHHVPAEVLCPPQLETLQVKSLSAVVRPPSDFAWRATQSSTSEMDAGGVLETGGTPENESGRPEVLKNVQKLPSLKSYDSDFSFHFPIQWVINTNPHHPVLPISPFTQLACLSIAVDPTSNVDIMDFGAILRVAASTLEDLDIRIKFCPGRNMQVSIESLPFAKLKRLSTLRFHLHSHIYPHGWCPIDLPSVSAVLSSFSPPPHSLKRVDIILDLYAHGQTGFPRMFEPHRDDWLTLDDTISSPMLSSVKRFKLVIRPHLVMRISNANALDENTEEARETRLNLNALDTSIPPELRSKVDDDYRGLIHFLIPKSRTNPRLSMFVKSTVHRIIVD